MDFTSMSDAQIIAYFKNPTGSTCGKFHQDQLDRSMEFPKKRLPWVKYFFQVAIPTFLFSTPSAAQSVLGDTIAVVQAPVKKTPPAKEKPKTQVVNGKVVDQKGVGVPFASVIITGTKIGTLADESGNFSIEAESVKRLTVAAVGYLSQTRDIGPNQIIKITLAQVSEFLGEVVITVPYEEKWPFFSSKGLDPYSNKKQTTYTAIGRVLDENGEPLEAASVIVDNSENGTATTKDGRFLIRLGDTKKYMLTFSRTGYKSVTKNVKGDFNGDIQLDREDQVLDTVTVNAAEGRFERVVALGMVTRIRGCKPKGFISRIFSDSASHSFTVYPNPAKAGTTVTVQWNKAGGDQLWQLMDASGKLVATGTQIVSAKSESFPVLLPNVSGGIYYFTLRSRSGKVYTEKILIQ
jgi:hypothetical protein